MKNEQTLRKIYELAESLENSLRYDENMMLRRSKAKDIVFPSNNPEPSPVVQSPKNKIDLEALNLNGLCSCVGGCDQCDGNSRLFGEGPVKPKVMFILDQPSKEDVANRALFSGANGAFFDKWIAAVSLRRNDVYLTSLLKCRYEPIPELGDPRLEHCQPYLKAQIALLQPTFIFALGQLTAQVFFRRKEGLDSLRGRIKPVFGVPLICSYSMEQVLEDPKKKALIWADLKTLRSNLEL